MAVFRVEKTKDFSVFGLLVFNWAGFSCSGFTCSGKACPGFTCLGFSRLGEFGGISGVTGCSWIVYSISPSRPFVSLIRSLVRYPCCSSSFRAVDMASMPSLQIWANPLVV